jgi:hypothetical protein
MMLVGDTGFEPVTSSVSAISDTPDNAAAGVSFLVWCSATALLMSHGKVKLFGIGVMALAVSAEIHSYGVRYFVPDPVEYHDDKQRDDVAEPGTAAFGL